MKIEVLRVLRSRWVRRGALGVAAIILVIASVGFAYEARARDRALIDLPPPGTLVDVPGGPIHVYCVGQGSPTVLLEAGAAQPSVAWWPVQHAVSGSTRVCSYDRAGIGWSSAARGSFYPEEVSQRLRASLEAANVPPPYVMVGHSIGGPLSMVFGDLFNSEVVGYVFVDSADPDRYDMLPVEPPAAHGPALRLAGAVRTALAASGLTRWQMRNARRPPHWPEEVFEVAVAFAPQSTRANAGEQAGAHTVVRRAADVHTFGSSPVVVLTGESSLQNAGAPMPPAEWEDARRRMQAAIAARSTNSDLRYVSDTGHNVHLDAPAEVIQAIHDVLSAVRSGHQLDLIDPQMVPR